MPGPGEEPHSIEKQASLRSRWGLSPAATSSAPAVSWPMPRAPPAGGLRWPSWSLAWATWLSRWVSTPTVIGWAAVACAMLVMAVSSPDWAGDGTRAGRTDSTVIGLGEFQRRGRSTSTPSCAWMPPPSAAAPAAATESFGAGLDRRIGADDLEALDQLPAHVAELVRAAWALGGRPELAGLRLRAWAHMLGFRGHWSTKSRRYSTTMTALRRARVAFAKRRRAKDGVPLDAWGRPENDQAVIIVASWVFVGSGYETEGERWLALSAAARARERRRIAREELTTTTASATAA